MSNIQREKRFNHVLITGGAGYVGAVLTPQLLNAGYRVTVLDIGWYGFEDVLPADHPNLTLVKGDLRDLSTVRHALSGDALGLPGVDAVIHLACVSNDPSFELNPDLGKSINLDAFEPLVDASIDAGVKRFIYASSSSVYGVSDSPSVTEDHPLHPLTDYSRFKEQCEPVLLGKASKAFVPLVIRPATVCGYSPRQRLDVIVNILTNHAVNNKRIRVFGGAQLRPNLHIHDMADAYQLVLEAPDDAVNKKVWNVGSTNHTVSEIAAIVKRIVERQMPELGEIATVVEPTDDPRSYHVNSDKIKHDLGFTPKRTIEDAVKDLCDAFREGKLPASMTDPKYFNVKIMQQLPVSV
jgi:nucleoside-diphosphate-sugar epimerase